MHIDKTYDRSILCDVNCSFEASKLYVIKGISGSGKTTLLQILGLIDNDFDGTYYFQNTDIKKLKKRELEKIRHQIGYMRQESLLIPELTVYENLHMFSNDVDNIKTLAEHFSISDLLEKFPSQLSNGERQRVSLIRALLQDIKVLLCDEPTASLDDETSKQIVHVIQNLRNHGMCIIVATHEDCFDEACDELISIRDGKCVITSINEHHSVMEKPIIKEIDKKQKYIKQDINYALLRNKKKRFVFSIFCVIFFFFTFTALGAYFHFEDSYTTAVINDYPTHTFIVTNDFINKKIKKAPMDQVIQYDDYRLIENDTIYTTYLPYRDSTLRIPNAIIYGNFPKKNNEVLVNQIYAEREVNKNNIESLIGNEIHIPNTNKEYKISGIIGLENDVVFDKNPYYTNAKSSAFVFIAYDDGKKLFSKTENDSILMSVKEDATSDAWEYFQNREGLFSWDSIIEEKVFVVQFVTMIIFGIVISILFISFLFLYQMVNLEMYHRRREFGYLRLFGISNHRISRIVSMHYFYQIIVPLGITLILYYLMIGIYSYINYDILLSFLEIIVLCFIISMYTYILLIIPIHKMKKAEIKELIETKD